MEKQRMKLEDMGIGIKDVKEVLKTGIQIGEGIDKSLEDDGKISIWESVNFFPALMSMRAAINDIDQVPAQLANIDESEAEELKQFIIDELDLSNDVTEELIEKIFSDIMDAFKAVMRITEKVKQLKQFK